MGAFLSSGRSPVSEVAEAGGGEAAVIDAPVDRRAALGGGEVVESSNDSVAAGGDTSRTGLIGSVRPTPSRGGGLFLDTSDILLNGLKNAGAITQVPYMKEAAGVLLQVVNTIQAVRDNQDAFHRLVDHAGCIILSTTRTMKPPKEITGDMESALKKIRDVVLKIEKLSDNKTRRRKIKRAFSAGSDKVEIGKLREDLDTAVLVFGVDAAIILNADINELTQCVRQLMNEDPRGSRAGAADGPSSDPSSATPSPLPACSSGDSTPLPSIEVSDVNIQDGAFNHLSGDIDGSNEGEGAQSISAPNFVSGIDGNVHMNSSVASHSRSRSRGSRRSRTSRRSSRSPSPSFIPSTDHLRRTARASPSPSVAVLASDDDHSHEALQEPPSLSSPRSSSPAPLRVNPQSTSFSGIKVNNGAFNYVNSPCNVTNKGSGTQTFHGSNIATNVGGNVTMNCGNVTKITTTNSNNDNSRRYYGSRSSRMRGRSVS